MNDGSRFNGAAPVRTRIDLSAAAAQMAMLRLQWGRACEDADSTRFEDQWDTQLLGFNGAAPVRTRIGRIPSNT